MSIKMGNAYINGGYVDKAALLYPSDTGVYSILYIKCPSDYYIAQSINNGHGPVVDSAW